MAVFNMSEGWWKTQSKKKTKDNQVGSVWLQVSNKRDGLPSIPNAKDAKVPKEVLHYVGSELEKNSFKVTIPMLEGLKEDGVGGLQTAEGKGETVGALYADAFWNTSRKVVNVNVKGVELHSVAYLETVKDAHSNISDFFADDKDYGCQMALLEGGDRYITNDDYWKDYTEQKTAPRAKSIHPNIAYPGMSAAITRSATYATDMDNIVNELKDIPGSARFSLASLDGCVDYAQRLKPLNYSANGNKVDYLILVSKEQARQLRRDPEWIELMKSAEKRGPDNRALSGILGVYLNALVIQDIRSPILNLNAKKFEYVTPVEANLDADKFYGYAKLNRKQGETMEIARVLGAGAIGCPLVYDIQWSENKRDHGYQNELCGEIARGFNRLDFRGKEKDGSAKIKNISSALYFTPTPAITY